MSWATNPAFEPARGHSKNDVLAPPKIWAYYTELGTLANILVFGLFFRNCSTKKLNMIPNYPQDLIRLMGMKASIGV